MTLGLGDRADGGRLGRLGVLDVVSHQVLIEVVCEAGPAVDDPRSAPAWQLIPSSHKKCAGQEGTHMTGSARRAVEGPPAA